MSEKPALWEVRPETRAAERGRTYPGVAAAMADQWGIW